MKAMIIRSTSNLRLIHLLALATLLGLLSLSGRALANPEVGADYSTINAVSIASTSSASPTVIRTATVACPVAGFTIAHANAEFALFYETLGFAGYIAYSISRNSTAFNFASYHTIRSTDPTGYEALTGAILRADPCTAGQSVTYRFLAYRVTGLSSVTVWHPSLAVVAYRDRY